MQISQISPIRQLTKAYSALLRTDASLVEIKHSLVRLQPPEPLVIEREVIVAKSDRPVDIYERMGLTLLLDKASLVDQIVIDSGEWEPEQQKFIAGLVTRLHRNRKLTFLDIGSYWGLYSLVAAKSGLFESIYTFDADRHNYAQLQANLFLNNAAHAVKTFNNAVSERPGTLRFWDSRTHPHGNRAGVGVIGETQDLPGYHVEAVTIDSIDLPADNTLLIKMDVEGHEDSALRGMEKTLAAHKAVIQIEIYEQNHDRIYAEVNRLGLRTVHSIYPDHYITNMTSEELGI